MAGQAFGCGQSPEFMQELHVVPLLAFGWQCAHHGCGGSGSPLFRVILGSSAWTRVSTGSGLSMWLSSAPSVLSGLLSVLFTIPLPISRSFAMTDGIDTAPSL